MEETIIQEQASIRDSIRRLNESSTQILVVVDTGMRLVGVLTDGDIRRGILANIELEATVSTIMNREPTFVLEKDRGLIGELIRSKRILAVPVLDDVGVVQDLVYWHDLFPGDERSAREPRLRSNSVFLLAGGRGTRLRPFTNILPKPLIPIGEVPIVEIIMRRFREAGFSQFILSLNYKADMIRSYFAGHQGGYDVEYVQEEEYSGTAGSLALVRSRIQDSLIVSNCDILVNMDMAEFFEHHQACMNDATIVGVMRHVEIPYGVMQIENGALIDMKEKPVFDLIVNAGIYVLEPSVLRLLPEAGFLDMPDLLWKAKESGLKVGVYPISSDLVDIGHWDEYNLAVDRAHKMGLI